MIPVAKITALTQVSKRGDLVDFFYYVDMTTMKAGDVVRRCPPTFLSLAPIGHAQARQSGAICTVGAHAAARAGMLDAYEIHNRGGRPASTYRSSKNSSSWD